MFAALKERSLDSIAVGSKHFFDLQRQLIFSRPLLKRCYDEWYARMRADIQSVKQPGVLVELGSGGSYLNQSVPDVVTSDVVDGVADMVIDARKLPFEDGSIRALLLTHVLHHIPELEKFFAEADRTLVPGGVISMIEVAHTPFARFFFSNFHHEPYVDSAKDWNFSQSHAMMDSNQALSWMVFVRDRERFERLFPTLKIEAFGYMPWFTYLISGGVTMKDLIPGFLVKPLIAAEWLLTPLRPLAALHWHIRIRKTG